MYTNTYKLQSDNSEMSEEYKIKMAVIAGASHALKFKEKNIRATDSEVIQHVSASVDQIIRKIMNEDEE